MKGPKSIFVITASLISINGYTQSANKSAYLKAHVKNQADMENADREESRRNLNLSYMVFDRD